jgi:hypothetical protein
VVAATAVLLSSELSGFAALSGGALVKQLAMCAGLVLALSVVTVSMILWGILPALNCAAAGAVVAVVGLRATVARDRAMRRLVCAAYEVGVDAVGLRSVVQVLGTPDVVQARTDHLRAEEARLAGRYANGDASDY